MPEIQGAHQGGGERRAVGFCWWIRNDSDFPGLRLWESLGMFGISGLEMGLGRMVWEIPRHWPCERISACPRIMFEQLSNLPGQP